MRMRWLATSLSVLGIACTPAEQAAPVIIATPLAPAPAPVDAEPPAPTSPIATAPVAATAAREETPPPPADYLLHADVVKAGKKALGKMVRMQVRRDHYTSSKMFTAVPCKDSGLVWLRYKPEQRDWVRAMHGTPHSACATVSFKVVSNHGGPAPLVEGSIEHIGTLTPKPAEPAPPGADFASIDDAILAGPDAKGKVIVTDVWAYDGDPKELWVHDCHRSDSFLFVIPKGASQQANARLLSNKPGRCGRAHLLVTNPEFVLGKNDGSMQRPLAEVVSVP
jgi:hypothetical protein